jgi:hypothetical protein
LEEILEQLKTIKTQLIKSKAGDAELTYDTLLNDDTNAVLRTVSTRIGVIGSWQKLRIAALTRFDEDALFDQIITLNILQESVVKAITIKAVVTYHVLGKVEGVMLFHSLLTGVVELGVAAAEKHDSIRARDLINQIPQNMVLDLPEELSKMLMLVDDIFYDVSVRLDSP